MHGTVRYSKLLCYYYPMIRIIYYGKGYKKNGLFPPISDRQISKRIDKKMLQDITVAYFSSDWNSILSGKKQNN